MAAKAAQCTTSILLAACLSSLGFKPKPPFTPPPLPTPKPLRNMQGGGSAPGPARRSARRRAALLVRHL